MPFKILFQSLSLACSLCSSLNTSSCKNILLRELVCENFIDSFCSFLHIQCLVFSFFFCSFFLCSSRMHVFLHTICGGLSFPFLSFFRFQISIRQPIGVMHYPGVATGLYVASPSGSSTVSF